jgi:adenylosuccinate lyase
MYEQLRALTRGTGITQEALQELIRGLPIPEDARECLFALTPATYVGKASELASRV